VMIANNTLDRSQLVRAETQISGQADRTQPELG
jgi:hypothetical protein